MDRHAATGSTSVGSFTRFDRIQSRKAAPAECLVNGDLTLQSSGAETSGSFHLRGAVALRETNLRET